MGTQSDEATDTNTSEGVSEDDGGFGAAFNAGVTGEQPTGTAGSEQENSFGGQEAPAESAEAEGGQEAPAEGGQESGQEAPAEGGQPPSDAQVTQGDGGTPPDPRGAERQQQTEGYDPATINAILERLGQSSSEGQAGQGGQQPAESQQPTQPQIPSDWTEYLSEEDRSTLSEYDREWGEVSQAEQIRTQAMVRLARDQVLSQVQQALNPVYEHMQQAQVSSHFDQVRQAHPDFDEVRNGPLQEWVKGMTNSVVRKAAEETLQQGTTQEVIDLVAMYKEATGGTQASGQSTGAAPSVPASASTPAFNSSQSQGQTGKGQGAQAPQAGPTNPRAASATAAVRSGSRGNDPRGSDPDDFTAGFRDQAANQ